MAKNGEAPYKFAGGGKGTRNERIGERREPTSEIKEPTGEGGAYNSLRTKVYVQSARNEGRFSKPSVSLRLFIEYRILRGGRNLVV